MADLNKVTLLEEAATHGAQQHEFGTVYHNWMNQKTFTIDPCTRQQTWSWTHDRAQSSHDSPNYLWRNKLVFVYLNPPNAALNADRVRSTTNSLEGGINPHPTCNCLSAPTTAKRGPPTTNALLVTPFRNRREPSQPRKPGDQPSKTTLSTNRTLFEP